MTWGHLVAALLLQPMLPLLIAAVLVDGAVGRITGRADDE